MEITILAFGKIADITGRHEWKIKGVSDTGSVRKHLEINYPSLKKTMYVMAVDKKIVQNNSALNENSVVALLPPFSGG